MISTTMYVRLNITYLWTSRVLRRWRTDQVDKAENIAWRHKSHSGSLICGANTTRCVRTELLARPAPGPAFAKIATACLHSLAQADHMLISGPLAAATPGVVEEGQNHSRDARGTSPE